jgi:hypothetical protein
VCDVVYASNLAPPGRDAFPSIVHRYGTSGFDRHHSTRMINDGAHFFFPALKRKIAEYTDAEHHDLATRKAGPLAH